MVKTGISTASLFLREFNEDALTLLNNAGITSTEVFLATYCEYTREFGEILRAKKGGLDVNSVHVLNTQFEPQLFSRHQRALNDAFGYLESVMGIAEMLQAKYYTFHGIARLKKSTAKGADDFEYIGEKTNKIAEVCKKYGVTLCFENVHWAHYDRPGFYSQLKKRCKDIKGVLDIKQVRQSGFRCEDYIEDMGGDIVTVHLSDVTDTGKIALPGKGIFDFEGLFKRLKTSGFDGALLIEVYKDDYNEVLELIRADEYIKELAYKIF